MRKIGVLTSGGDAPGMNAAVRAVTRYAVNQGLKVVGFKKGYRGLLSCDYIELNERSVSDTLHRGGTMLQTARCPEFKEEENVKKAVNIASALGIDGMVVIGGDGSFRGARALSLNGLPTVGVPATIDNDIGCSDYSIGFDTALNTVKDAIDKIRDTARSHERCSIIEVMGRNAGYIAAYVAMACGAEAAIVPEQEYDFYEDIIKPIEKGRVRGKEHNLFVVAEGVGNSVDIAARIEKETGIATRATILGYIQRGGSPTVNDRIIASRMGAHAVKLLLEGGGNRIVAMKDNQMVDYDIYEGLEMEKTMDPSFLELLEILSM